MEYSMENDQLKLTVTTWGAQVKSVVHKGDGVEHIWQADRDIWGYHAPILFPYCGKLAEKKFEAKGQVYTTGQHGFARYMEHSLLTQTGDTIVMELRTNSRILKKFPYRFRLLSTFTLEGDTIHHTLTVENRDTEPLSFGIGFHPAFNVPFDDRHRAEDYELRFSELESPICLNTLPHDLIHGNIYLMPTNITAIPVNEHIFARGGHCMVNLRSAKLGLFEKDSGRGVVCDIGPFPYTTIWSKPGTPRFVCISPSYSLPSPEGGSIRWEDKAAAAIVAPGQSWSCTLNTAFLR